MNERIKEIGEKAGLFMERQHPGGFPNEELSVAYKFAELIVQECIERVRIQYTVQRDLLNRTEREQGRVECGVASVIALEELVQESTDRWYKENILGDEE